MSASIVSTTSSPFFPSPVHAHHIVNDRRMQNFSHKPLLTSADISNIFRAYRGRLDMTYWKTEENDRVCMDAMSVMDEITIESICDRTAVSSYVSLMREVYLHAVANLKGFRISDDERRLKMLQQWKEIEKHFLKIKPAMERCWKRDDEPGLVAIFLTLAVLYAQYKEVCDEDIIYVCYEAAQRARSLSGDQMSLEVEQYCSIIEDIFFLRRQRYSKKKSQFVSGEDDNITAKSVSKPRNTLNEVLDKRRALDGQALLAEYGRMTYKPKTTKEHHCTVNGSKEKHSSDSLSSTRGKKVIEETKSRKEVRRSVRKLPSTYTESIIIEKSETKDTYRSGKFFIHIKQVSTTNDFCEPKFESISSMKPRRPVNDDANDNKHPQEPTDSDFIKTVNGTKVIVEGFTELRLSDESGSESKTVPSTQSSSYSLLQKPLLNQWDVPSRSDDVISTDLESPKSNEISAVEVKNTESKKNSKTECTYSPSGKSLSSDIFDEKLNECEVRSKTGDYGAAPVERRALSEGSVETAASFEYVRDNKSDESKKKMDTNNTNLSDGINTEEVNSATMKKQKQSICIILEGISPTTVKSLKNEVQSGIMEQQIYDISPIIETPTDEGHVTSTILPEATNEESMNTIENKESSVISTKLVPDEDILSNNDVTIKTTTSRELRITSCSTETNVEMAVGGQTKLENDTLPNFSDILSDKKQEEGNSRLSKVLTDHEEEEAPATSVAKVNAVQTKNNSELKASKRNEVQDNGTDIQDSIFNLKSNMLTELKLHASKTKSDQSKQEFKLKSSNNKVITEQISSNCAETSGFLNSSPKQLFLRSTKEPSDRKDSKATVNRLNATTLEQEIKEMLPKLKHVTVKETASTINVKKEEGKVDDVFESEILKYSGNNKNITFGQNEEVNKEETIVETLKSSVLTKRKADDNNAVNIYESRISDVNGSQMENSDTATLPSFDAKLEFERRLGSKASKANDKRPITFYRKIFIDETNQVASCPLPTEPPPDFPVIVKNLDNKFQHEKRNSQEPQLHKRKTLLTSEKPDFNFILGDI